MAADIELRKLTKAIEAQTRAIEKQNRLLEIVNTNIVAIYQATIQTTGGTDVRDS